MSHPILNIRDIAPGEGRVYVARPSPLGNPYEIGRDGERAVVIQKYAVWLDERLRERDPVVLTALLGIRAGDALVCHCAPKRCHAEVIAQVLARADWRPRSDEAVRCYAYAGVGSRNTPPEVLLLMTGVAHRLAAHGYTLCSGGAPGADLAFERGATTKAIFLPWHGFQSRPSAAHDTDQPSAEAFRVAALLHPSWDRLSQAAQKLMARNTHQILGADLRSPVDFVVCWTPDGCEAEAARRRTTGGTGQAIALASRWSIPVFNLQHGRSALDRLGAHITLATPVLSTTTNTPGEVAPV